MNKNENSSIGTHNPLPDAGQQSRRKEDESKENTKNASGERDEFGLPIRKARKQYYDEEDEEILDPGEKENISVKKGGIATKESPTKPGKGTVNRYEVQTLYLLVYL